MEDADIPFPPFRMRSLLFRFRKAIPLAYAKAVPYRPAARRLNLPGVWFDISAVSLCVLFGIANWLV